jgi:predicted hydrocarbon binding protein
MLSNRLIQLFLDSTIQEIGPERLQTILADNHLLPELLEGAARQRLGGMDAARVYASLQQALRLYYGQGARGTLLRIGSGMWGRMVARAGFLEKAELEIARRLPVPARRRRILEQVAGFLREDGGDASIHTRDLDLLLVDHSSAATLNQTSAQPICFVTLGLIQAAFLWATGQDADVEEIACKAAGAPACEFKITLGSK